MTVNLYAQEPLYFCPPKGSALAISRWCSIERAKRKTREGAPETTSFWKFRVLVTLPWRAKRPQIQGFLFKFWKSNRWFLRKVKGFLGISIWVIGIFFLPTNCGAVARILRDVKAYRLPTAGAHEPTFFSLQGQEKALHQQVAKQRVDGLHCFELFFFTALSICFHYTSTHPSHGGNYGELVGAGGSRAYFFVLTFWYF